MKVTYNKHTNTYTATHAPTGIEVKSNIRREAVQMCAARVRAANIQRAEWRARKTAQILAQAQAEAKESIK